MSRTMRSVLVGLGVVVVASVVVTPLEVWRAALIFTGVAVCHYLWAEPPR